MKIPIPSLQEFLNVTAQKVIEQGEPSFRNVGMVDEKCAYRGDGGRKCAIGHWIPDELYKPEWDDMTRLEYVLGCIFDGPIAAKFYGLALGLQGCHDGAAYRRPIGESFVDGFKRRVRVLCEQFELEVPECCREENKR